MRKNKTTRKQRVRKGVKNAKAETKAINRKKENRIKLEHRNTMFKHEIQRRRKFLESLAEKAMKERLEKEKPPQDEVKINTENK